MRRRRFLQESLLVGVAGFAGCTDSTEPTGRRNSLLSIFPMVEKSGETWNLTAEVRNQVPNVAGYSNVRIVAFSDHGTQICQKPVGDLPRTGDDVKVVSLKCNRFPAIVSSISDNAPCNGNELEIVYWVGNRKQRTTTSTGTILWKTTLRRCDETLPPERVLEKMDPDGTETSE